MFPENLKYFRKRANLTQQELADKLGVSRSTIGMYEYGGREPDFETLEMIADFFNVNMSTLIGEKEKAPSISAEGLTDEQIELVRLFRGAGSAYQAAALALLREAEAAHTVQDDELKG